MATATRGNVYRNTGTLYANPVDSANLGTQLGAANLNSIRIDHGMRSALITAEELGGRSSDALLIQRDSLIAWVQRGWDADAIPLIFPGATLGGGSGAPIVNIPGGVDGASLGATSTISLLYKNDHDSRPSFLFPNLVILPELSARMTFSLRDELKVAVAGIGLVGAGGYSVRIANFEDLGL